MDEPKKTPPTCASGKELSELVALEPHEWDSREVGFSFLCDWSEDFAAVPFVTGAFAVSLLAVAALTNSFGGELRAGAEGARTVGILLRAEVLTLAV